jgi:hypothetical protein
VSTLVDRLLGRVNYRKVEETYDLRWTNRYSFEFTRGVTEAVAQELAPGEKGGNIVFSTQINATAQQGIVGFAKAFVQSLWNRVDRVDKVDAAEKEAGLPTTTGFTLGNNFQGRYRSPDGQVFNERSLTLDVLMITKDQLIQLGTALCHEFDQQSVLVRSFDTGEIYFVDGR